MKSKHRVRFMNRNSNSTRVVNPFAGDFIDNLRESQRKFPLHPDDFPSPLPVESCQGKLISEGKIDFSSAMKRLKLAHQL